MISHPYSCQPIDLAMQVAIEGLLPRGVTLGHLHGSNEATTEVLTMALVHDRFARWAVAQKPAASVQA